MSLAQYIRSINESAKQGIGTNGYVITTALKQLQYKVNGLETIIKSSGLQSETSSVLEQQLTKVLSKMSNDVDDYYNTTSITVQEFVHNYKDFGSSFDGRQKYDEVFKSMIITDLPINALYSGDVIEFKNLNVTAIYDYIKPQKPWLSTKKTVTAQGDFIGVVCGSPISALDEQTSDFVQRGYDVDQLVSGYAYVISTDEESGNSVVIRMSIDCYKAIYFSRVLGFSPELTGVSGYDSQDITVTCDEIKSYHRKDGAIDVVPTVSLRNMINGKIILQQTLRKASYTECYDPIISEPTTIDSGRFGIISDAELSVSNRAIIIEADDSIYYGTTGESTETVISNTSMTLTSGTATNKDGNVLSFTISRSDFGTLESSVGLGSNGVIISVDGIQSMTHIAIINSNLDSVDPTLVIDSRLQYPPMALYTALIQTSQPA